MQLAEAPVVDVRGLFPQEREDLLELLRGLTNEEWLTCTAVPAWRVKDIALHLLDADLGWLSRGRDLDRSGLIERSASYRDFVAALSRKNQRWVDAASGMSQRIACDLMAWSGAQVDDFYATIDLTGSARVAWASDGAVPAWLDLARDFTERWAHQQQIRDALDRPGRHEEKYLDVVLKTFVWAFPHQFDADAAPSSQVEIDLGEGGAWVLTRAGTGWELDSGRSASPIAQVEMSGDAAWRSLTGACFNRTGVRRWGPSELCDAVMAVRGIIV